MRRLVPSLLAAALLAASCSGDDGEPIDSGAAESAPLRIYAASSLEDVFRELAPDAEFRFGDSEELGAAIRDGAVADVFASASPDPIADLRTNALVEPPVAFATNRLVLVVPADNPAGIESLDDLGDVHLWVGAELDYVEATLDAIGKGTLADPVDASPDAVDRVASGEADAALVYYTDALTAGDAVRVIDLPAQALAEYLVAPATVRPDNFEAAVAFVELLQSQQGRAALEAAGFTLPPAG